MNSVLPGSCQGTGRHRAELQEIRAVAMTVGATKIQILHDSTLASMSASGQAEASTPREAEPEAPAKECPS